MPLIPNLEELLRKWGRLLGGGKRHRHFPRGSAVVGDNDRRKVERQKSSRMSTLLMSDA
jgi:hypothetical protein